MNYYLILKKSKDAEHRAAEILCQCAKRVNEKLCQVLRPLKRWIESCRNKSRHARFSLDEQIAFARRLAFLLSARIPLADALHMIGHSMTETTKQGIVRGIHLQVNEGVSFSKAILNSKNIVPSSMVCLLEIGEECGTLAENLSHIAGELAKKKEFRKKLIGSLIYPACILVFALCITLFLVLYIVPKIMPAFLGMKVALPSSTRALMLIVSTIKSHYIVILLCIVLCALCLWKLWNTLRMKHWRDRIILRLPYIRALCVSYHSMSLSRILRTMLISGIDLPKALLFAAEVTSHSVYRSILSRASIEVYKGKKLCESTKDAKTFPALFTQMIEVGEITGTLRESFGYISEMYESEFNSSIKSLTQLIEPMVMVVLGLVVGFVTISIISPIYAITQTIGS
jgi:type II secretory pathway component PulF